MIVTEINNRHLDPSTKEEVRLIIRANIILYLSIMYTNLVYENLQLQIFQDQLCAYSAKFTIFDLLTVNNRLFTSVSNF